MLPVVFGSTVLACVEPPARVPHAESTLPPILIVQPTDAVLPTPVAPTPVETEAFPQREAPVPIDNDDPQVGDRSAPLTLVVFCDYADPFSMHFVRGGIAALQGRFGGDLRIVYKDFPLDFHPNARLAAAAAHGVYARGGAPAFAKFLENLAAFKGALDASTLAGFAVVAGVGDRAAFERDLMAGVWDGSVERNLRSAKGLRVSGTPTSFLNGLRVVGSVTSERMANAFDIELRESRAVRERGVALVDVYGLRTKANFGQDLALDAATTPAAKPAPTLGPPRGTDGAPSRVGETVRVVPTKSLGPFFLGMSEKGAAKIGPSKAYGRGWTCFAGDALSDRCTYRVHIKDRKVDEIAFEFGISTSGMEFDGRRYPSTAPFDQIRRALGCGEWSIGIGASSAVCPGNVSISLGSGACYKAVSDEESAPCRPLPNGRPSITIGLASHP